MRVGDPIYVLTGDAAGTIDLTSVDEINGRNIIVRGPGGTFRAHMIDRTAFTAWEPAVRAAEQARDARIKQLEREISQLRARTWTKPEGSRTQAG